MVRQKEARSLRNPESRSIPFSFLTLLNNIYSKTERKELGDEISDPMAPVLDLDVLQKDLEKFIELLSNGSLLND